MQSDHIYTINGFLLRKQKEFWKGSINVTVFLFERNLAFRGTNKNVCFQSNVNFLGLIELIVQLDGHQRTLDSAKMNNHFLSKDIVNGLISFITKMILSSNFF